MIEKLVLLVVVVVEVQAGRVSGGLWSSAVVVSDRTAAAPSISIAVVTAAYGANNAPIQSLPIYNEVA